MATESNVAFYAGESIGLFPGFHAEAGSEFLAKIEICENPISINEITANNGQELEANQLLIGSELPEIKTTLADGSYLKAYPNPVGTALVIKCEFFTEKNNINEKTEIYLTDMLGRIIIHESTIGNGISTSFDLTSIESGMYQLVLQNGNKTLIERIVKII